MADNTNGLGDNTEKRVSGAAVPVAEAAVIGAGVNTLANAADGKSPGDPPPAQGSAQQDQQGNTDMQGESATASAIAGQPGNPENRSGNDMPGGGNPSPAAAAHAITTMQAAANNGQIADANGNPPQEALFQEAPRITVADIRDALGFDPSHPLKGKQQDAFNIAADIVLDAARQGNAQGGLDIVLASRYYGNRMQTQQGSSQIDGILTTLQAAASEPETAQRMVTGYMSAMDQQAAANNNLPDPPAAASQPAADPTAAFPDHVAHKAAEQTIAMQGHPTGVLEGATAAQQAQDAGLALAA